MSEIFYKKIVKFKQQQGSSLPDGIRARRFVRRLFVLLFIGKGEAENNEFETQVQLRKLERLLQLLLLPLLPGKSAANEQAGIFFKELPTLYSKLLQDATALLEADPAAQDLDEVLLTYPGFFAIVVHRFAHQLYQQKIPLLPRVLSEYAHSKTGIDIHPAAQIGDAFVIDHGTGIVIGETTVIGNQVKIYQGVTLGALSVLKDKATTWRHPTIEDNVVIYSGATILGGNTIVGRDSIIGGNVWLTNSVPPHSVVFHQAGITIRDKKSFTEPYNFFI